MGCGLLRINLTPLCWGMVSRINVLPVRRVFRFNRSPPKGGVPSQTHEIEDSSVTSMQYKLSPLMRLEPLGSFLSLKEDVSNFVNEAEITTIPMTPYVP